MVRWHFGLDSAAIRDGTYTDLHRGQPVAFVVELQWESWDRASAAGAGAARVEGCRYDLVARVEAVGPGTWVLDCGLLVGGAGRPPEGIEVSEWITGRARLDLSPVPARLEVPGLPALARTWFVERVHHRTEADDLGLGDQGLYGGPEEPGWEELAFTDAWGDDDGQAEYLVECLPVID